MTATISDRLGELRLRRGLTQEGLADKAQLSTDTVRKLEPAADSPDGHSEQPCACVGRRDISTARSPSGARFIQRKRTAEPPHPPASSDAPVRLPRLGE
ncbi:helix-turn-helix transcriptional regulator [Streptomyces sp. NBC_01481]|nr:helix-turn-helix transcriptional regulator [Streptomyces sp. NBC_01481]